MARCLMTRSRSSPRLVGESIIRSERPAVFGERLVLLCGQATGGFASTSWPMIGVSTSGRSRLVSTFIPGPRRRHRDLPEVSALGGCRLGPLQLVEHGAEVALQRGRFEAGLADGDVHVAVAIGAVLDLATLELGDGPADVLGDGAGLRVRHQATRADTRPRRPTSGIMSGVAMARSKSILPFWISSARSSAPTMSAPASRASWRPRPRRTRRRGRPCRCRQGDGATHHLVGLAWVDAETDGDLDPSSNVAWPASWPAPAPRWA